MRFPFYRLFLLSYWSPTTGVIKKQLRGGVNEPQAGGSGLCSEGKVGGGWAGGTFDY